MLKNDWLCYYFAMENAHNIPSDSSLTSAEIIANLQKKLQEKDAHLKEKDIEIQSLYERLQLALQRHFGKRSEQLTDEDIKQLSLFDEDSNASVDELAAIAENEEDVTVDVPAHSRKASNKAKGFPAHLPREDVIHDLEEDDKQCHCGQPLKCIGEEVTEQVHIVPMQIKVIRHCVKKYACSQFD